MSPLPQLWQPGLSAGSAASAVLWRHRALSARSAASAALWRHCLEFCLDFCLEFLPDSLYEIIRIKMKHFDEAYKHFHIVILKAVWSIVILKQSHIKQFNLCFHKTSNHRDQSGLVPIVHQYLPENQARSVRIPSQSHSIFTLSSLIFVFTRRATRKTEPQSWIFFM
jgi:hypothetical protein